MKTIYRYLLLLVLAISATSCLKAGLDELETYDQNEVTNVRMEYRWWDEAGKRMRVVEMSVGKTIDKEAKVVSLTVEVPAATQTFTSAIREKVSLSGLAMNVDLSAAARIKPLGGAPALGTPSDLSAKEFVYQVTAANGEVADWTFKITNFKK